MSWTEDVFPEGTRPLLQGKAADGESRSFEGLIAHRSERSSALVPPKSRVRGRKGCVRRAGYIHRGGIARRS